MREDDLQKCFPFFPCSKNSRRLLIDFLCPKTNNDPRLVSLSLHPGLLMVYLYICVYMVSWANNKDISTVTLNPRQGPRHVSFPARHVRPQKEFTIRQQSQ